MDKSLDEIIGASRPAAEPKSAAPKGISKRRSSGRKPAPKKGGSAPPASARGFKAVFIRNLSDSISEDDIRDLFRQVGPVLRVHVERDLAGNRTGMAWVLYDFVEDAIVAAERYNQRKAAGKTITVRRVAHVGDTGAGLASLGDRIGVNAGSGNASAAGSSKSKRRRGGKSGRGGDRPKQPAKPRGAADLDAELDAYMQVESSVPSEQPAAPASSASAQAQPAEESMIDV